MTLRYCQVPCGLRFLEGEDSTGHLLLLGSTSQILGRKTAVPTCAESEIVPLFRTPSRGMRFCFGLEVLFSPSWSVLHLLC